MSNMSYCRFENTLGDLQECHENIESEGLSDSEFRARKHLIELCIEIVQDAKDMGLIEEDGDE